MREQDLLFVGAHGHVRALDKRTGRDAWTTSLPGTAYAIVSLLVEDGVLYAGSHGHVYALKPATGEVLWTNALPNLGYGPIMLATVRASSPPIVPSASAGTHPAAS